MSVIIVEENEIKKAYSELEDKGEVYRLDYIVTSPIDGKPERIDCYISKIQGENNIQFGYGSYNKDTSTYLRIETSVLSVDFTLQSNLNDQFYNDVSEFIS